MKRDSNPAGLLQAWREGRFELASITDPVEDADGSVDPNDNDLLGQAQASLSSFLVTGDKPHLLSMVRVGPARVVVTARTLVLRISVIADAGFSVIADGVSA